MQIFLILLNYHTPMAVYITRPRLVNVNIQMFQHPKIEEKNKGRKNKQNNSVKVNTTLQGSNGAVHARKLDWPFLAVTKIHLLSQYIISEGKARQKAP